MWCGFTVPPGTRDMVFMSHLEKCVYYTKYWCSVHTHAVVLPHQISTVWRSKGQAWPGTCPVKVRPAHVCASTSVVSAMVKHTAGASAMVKCTAGASAMVKRTAGARPIPMTWLLHCLFIGHLEFCIRSALDTHYGVCCTLDA